MSEIDIEKELFLCPVSFEEDPYGEDGLPLPIEEDKEIHFTSSAAKMISEGCRPCFIGTIPEGLVPSRKANILHFRVIKSPDGKSYIPLFISYETMINIFGHNIRVGVISFEDAKDSCITNEDVLGIVIAPGQINKIIPKEVL